MPLSRLIDAARRLLGRTVEVEMATSGGLRPDTLNLENHVVVAGYGQVGKTVCAMLENRSVPYVCVDRDPSVVSAARRAGRPVFLGDVAEAEILAAAGCGWATMLVLAVDDPAATERVVTTVQRRYPELAMQARVVDIEQNGALRELGVVQCSPPLVEFGLLMGSNVLRVLGEHEFDVMELAERIRRSNYALLRGRRVANRR